MPITQSRVHAIVQAARAFYDTSTHLRKLIIEECERVQRRTRTPQDALDNLLVSALKNYTDPRHAIVLGSEETHYQKTYGSNLRTAERMRQKRRENGIPVRQTQTVAPSPETDHWHIEDAETQTPAAADTATAPDTKAASNSPRLPLVVELLEDTIILQGDDVPEYKTQKLYTPDEIQQMVNDKLEEQEIMADYEKAVPQAKTFRLPTTQAETQTVKDPQAAKDPNPIARPDLVQPLESNEENT